jgi:hypothetical protein
MNAPCLYEPPAFADDVCCAAQGGSDLPLFDLATRCLAECVAELGVYGIRVDPRLELRRGDSRCCDDDPRDGHIHLALPDFSSHAGRLHARRLGASLGCSSDRELMRFFSVMIPWLVAHELGHHLRHRYGRSGDDLWAEERVANRLASALTRHHLSPIHRAHAASVLRRTLDAHASPVTTDVAPAAGYEDVLLAMHASWQYLDLMHHGSEYIADFARVYLGIEAPLLPLADEPGAPCAEQAIACFRAYLELLPRTRAGARYFYRRYRELVWAMLSASGAAAFQPDRARCGTAFFLEGWASLECDPLGDLEGCAPAALCALFPAHIASHPWFGLDIELHLPGEPDRRLFAQALRGTQDTGDDCDAAAVETLHRMALLDKTDIFASIPARSALEISRSLCPVRYAPGETICWQGDANDGVFCLVEGSAEVLVEPRGRTARRRPARGRHIRRGRLLPRRHVHGDRARRSGLEVPRHQGHRPASHRRQAPVGADAHGRRAREAAGGREPPVLAHRRQGRAADRARAASRVVNSELFNLRVFASLRDLSPTPATSRLRELLTSSSGASA